MLPRALVLVLICSPLNALGAEPRGAIYDVEPAVESTGSVAMLALSVLIDREKVRWDGLSLCSRERRAPTEEELQTFERLSEGEGACNIDSVPSFERFVVENDSHGARIASDVLLAVMAFSPYLFSVGDVLLSDVERPGLRFGEESLVALETQAATLLGVNVLKMMVRRPRPLTYNAANPKAERFDGDARLSFPSGHSAFSFASASLVAYGAALRHGNAPVTWVSGVLAYLTAGVVAYLRVEGGKHFVTDVVAGAVVGIALGLTIPRLHRRDDRVPPDGGSDQMMLSIGGTF